MSEEEVRRIVLSEIKISFQSLSADISTVKDNQTVMQGNQAKMQQSVNRIERLLLGDGEFKDQGFADKINASYEYVKKNIDADLVPRLTRSLNLYERWQDVGYWKTLEEIISRYIVLKWLTALIVSSGIISVVNLIELFIKTFRP